MLNQECPHVTKAIELDFAELAIRTHCISVLVTWLGLTNYVAAPSLPLALFLGKWASRNLTSSVAALHLAAGAFLLFWAIRVARGKVRPPSTLLTEASAHNQITISCAPTAASATHHTLDL